MDSGRDKLENASHKETAINNAGIDDRKMLTGMVVLIAIAFLALAIRNLLPDVNPVVLLALGVTIYGIYLGALILARLAQINEEEAALSPVEVASERTEQ